MSIEDIIGGAVDEKPVDVKNALADVMLDKVREAILDKKAEVAQRFFDASPLNMESDDETEDDELEDDLEDEDFEDDEDSDVEEDSEEESEETEDEDEDDEESDDETEDDLDDSEEE